MTIRVEIEGRGQVAEFPDGTPQEVIQSTIHKHFFSVADIARQRLADRGVDQDQQVNAEANQPPGFWQGVKDAVVPSTEAMANSYKLLPGNPQQIPTLIDMGKKMVKGQMEHSKEAGKQAAREGIHGNLPGFIASVAAAAPGALNPFITEALQGNLEHATGGAVGTAALLAGPEAAGVGGKLLQTQRLASAPAKIVEAEAAYKAAISTPETAEIAAARTPEMMGRNIKVVDASDQAVGAAANADSARASAAAIPYTPARRGSGGRFSANPKTAAAKTERGAWTTEAEFQNDLNTILSALPDNPTNVLPRTLSKVAGRAVEGAVGYAARNVGLPLAGEIGMGHAALGAGKDIVEAIKSVTASPKWKTTSAIAKRDFYKSLNAKDYATAAKIGAGIVSGQLIADDFGYKKAATELQQEAQSAGSPEATQQHISSHQPVYINPDGTRIPIPRGVAIATLNGDPTRSDNPTEKWLAAMAKQGKLKGGGRIEFDGLRSQSKTAAFNYDGEEAGRDEFEFVDADGNHENDALVQSTPLWELLPERFRTARKARGASYVGDLPAPARGRWGVNFDEQDEAAGGLNDLTSSSLDLINNGPADPAKWEGMARKLTYQDKEYPPENKYVDANTITSYGGEDNSNNPFILLHEYGHPTHAMDLTDAEVREWSKLYSAYKNPRSDAENALEQELQKKYQDKINDMKIGPARSALIKAMSNEENRRGAEVARKYPVPLAILNRIPIEAFPSVLAHYIMDPSKLRATYPPIYEFMRRVTGREYVGGKVSPYYERRPR